MLAMHADMLTQKQGDNMTEKQNQKFKFIYLNKSS